MRYNDGDYIRRYKEFGEFPHIHDDIFAISRSLIGQNVIDLGCCTGLLTLRLATRNNLVIGVEANAAFLDECISASNVKYRNIRVSADTLQDFAGLVDKYHIQTIYARRVLPELQETGGAELVADFIKLCYGHNVERFVIEGRKSNKNAVNPLSSVQKEVEAMRGFYAVEKSYNECRIMKRVEL